jgi:hypothetical protein
LKAVSISPNQRNKIAKEESVNIEIGEMMPDGVGSILQVHVGSS